MSDLQQHSRTETELENKRKFKESKDGLKRKLRRRDETIEKLTAEKDRLARQVEKLKSKLAVAEKVNKEQEDLIDLLTGDEEASLPSLETSNRLWGYDEVGKHMAARMLTTSFPKCNVNFDRTTNGAGSRHYGDGSMKIFGQTVIWEVKVAFGGVQTNRGKKVPRFSFNHIRSNCSHVLLFICLPVSKGEQEDISFLESYETRTLDGTFPDKPKLVSKYSTLDSFIAASEVYIYASNHENITSLAMKPNKERNITIIPGRAKYLSFRSKCSDSVAFRRLFSQAVELSKSF
jgi:hypothetical protein